MRKMKGVPSPLRIFAVGALIALALRPTVLLAEPPGKSATFDLLIAKAQKEMMGDPVAALRDAEAAEKLSWFKQKRELRLQATATSLWLEAEALIRVSRVAEARTAVGRASKLAASDGQITKLDGDLALARGHLADSNGDIAGALSDYQQAHLIFLKLGMPRGQSMALQGLGSIYDEAYQFQTEARYYREASQVYSGDANLLLSAANNRGFALLHMGRYAEALDDFRKALKIADDLKSGYLQAQILTNVATVEARLHNLADAQRDTNRALRLLGPKDEIGGTPFVWGIKAEIDYDRGALSRAAADLDRAFRNVDLAHTIMPFRDMHEIAYKVYSAQGNLALALAHIKAFKRLDDQGRSLAASANLALNSARFDFQRQQLEIARLKSAQLQRDIVLRRSRAAVQTAIFSGICVVGILFVTWIGWRHRVLKQHRNVIEHKNIELTHLLSERNREIARRIDTESQLRVAAEEAQQANRAKSHFLANMSHELRTPLNAIIGFSQLLSSGYVPPERTKEYSDPITEAGEHLLTVLNELLEMARIEAGRVVLDERRIELGEIIQSVIGQLENPHRQTVRFENPHGQLLVRADELRVRQILTNLLSNAMKFAPEAGVIQVDLAVGSDGVDLSVTDNGPGIPADKISAILEPFGQGEGAYSRLHGGLGLGLPIVKGLLELHRGRLIIDSIPGRTTVTAHLPQDRIETPQSNDATTMVSDRAAA